MLCWAHSALIGKQLSASHVLLQLSNLCQAFSKRIKGLKYSCFLPTPWPESRAAAWRAVQLTRSCQLVLSNVSRPIITECHLESPEPRPQQTFSPVPAARHSCTQISLMYDIFQPLKVAGLRIWDKNKENCRHALQPAAARDAYLRVAGRGEQREKLRTVVLFN